MVQATTERRPGSRKRSGHRRFWPGLCVLGPNIASKLDRALTGLSWLPGTWRELWPLACFALVWSNECKNLFKRNLGLQSPTQRPLNLWKPEGHSAWWQLRPHVKRLASLAAKLRSGWSNKWNCPSSSALRCSNNENGMALSAEFPQDTFRRVTRGAPLHRMANAISVYGSQADGLGDHPATKIWLRGFHQIHRSFVHPERARRAAALGKSRAGKRGPH